ncbi:MAG: bifunctional (p)ppGpp synthetase/guanosine-3',5'-bis(diphosphate) 3'-pyrophosphohydrolase, partial [Myxococcales bacterium]|nr:bifunctional (p)ppGpp synthetase/guanosine-3',5'-bis(diphosphate) 3'-pyrophosphohydrolase [Myxococcales bacterium]
ESTFESVRAVIAENFDGDGGELLSRARGLAEPRDPPAFAAALPAAQVLADLRLDPPAVAAACVVQAVEDGALPLDEVREVLGEEVAALVDGVRRLALIRWDRLDSGAVESLRKMFLAIAADVRVVLVALALRLRDLRDAQALGDAPPAERRRIARETLEIYAPLANRLGIFSLKWELEDLCLRELEPEIYRQISGGLAETREGRQRLIQEAIDAIGRRLAEAEIPAKISGRPKHIYSIYRKMQRKRVGLDEIYDASAVRVLVDRVQDCYAVLGLVHSLWTPITSEFDDYIAKPKGNGYQSLHTAVIGPGGKALEIQIRTHEMHQLGEYGVAAHWRYKENRRANRIADEKFNWLRQLMEWQKDVTDPRDFVESLKTDIFQDQVYVFTPQGDVIDLPVGATPVDFAYRVHTSVGHRCRGALVNGSIVPLDHKLQTGDRVEILTHRKPQPSRDWLSPQSGYVQSGSTRQKIRQWFRQQGRDDAIVQGRDLLERELRRVGLDRWKPEEIAELLELRSAEDMLASIGFGDTTSQTIAAKVLDMEREQARQQRAAEEEAALITPEPTKRSTPKRAKAAAGVSIAGIGDILSQPARCCTPVPGDPVIGYISRGRGVVIHRSDCPNIVSSPEPERLIEIDWGHERGQTYPVTIAVLGADRPGLMRDVLDVVSDYGVNLSQASVSTNKKDRSAQVTAVLEVQNNDQVVRILNKIERIADVVRAYRTTD